MKPDDERSEERDLDEHDDEAFGGRRRVERLLRETIRKGLEAGIGTISRTDRAIRGVTDDMRLPREAAGYVLSQLEETKNGLVRAMASEFRQFLESRDLSEAVRDGLTNLTFEIKTEIRFKPSESPQPEPPDEPTGGRPRSARARRSKTSGYGPHDGG